MSDNLTREVVATKLHEMANEIFGERGPLRLFSDHLAAAVLFIRADAAELTRLRADLASAQEREQRMREALANIVGNMEPDPDDPDRRRMLSNGFARWEALEADARAALSAMRGEP